MLSNKPKLYIPRKIMTKLMYWIDKAPGEIGGMGTISYKEENNYFWLRDVFLLEQEVTGGTTDLDAVALGKLEADILKTKAEGELNFWWHSHVNMSVFWSGTDESTIRQMGEQGYLVATVFNKKREMRSAVCSRVSTEYGQAATQFTDELETLIWDDQPAQSVVAQWEKDYNEKVKEKKYTPPASYNHNEYYDKWNDKAKNKDKKHWDKSVKTISSKTWGTPTTWKVRSVLDDWCKVNKSRGNITEAEKDDVLNAATMGMDITYLSYFIDSITDTQWTQLDFFAEDFRSQHPEFDWKLT